MGPGDLKSILEGLCLPESDDLIVGPNKADDAGVFRLDDETALILTMDFFTPIVDNPYTFGAIAAANALSDVYAMGGRPITALNICCFPPKEDKGLLREILRGGADKASEAGAVIAGGHSVRDEELKYGLAVTGLVHPSRIITNAGANPGDALLLTKPLGTGLLSTARRKDAIREKDFSPAVMTMLELNREASRIMIEAGASGCTDVTGFGFLGHAQEMACASGVALAIDYKKVPLLSRVTECAEKGFIPGGTRNNRAHFSGFMQGDISEIWWAILFDPQTSGGLLISLPPDKLDDTVRMMKDTGVDAAVIGEILPDPPATVILR